MFKTLCPKATTPLPPESPKKRHFGMIPKDPRRVSGMETPKTAPTVKKAC